MMRSLFFAAVLLELLCFSAWGDEPPAENAVYRLRQQEGEQETGPEPKEAARPKKKEGAGDAKIWSKEIGGLKLRIAPSREVYRLGEDVQVDLLLKNVSDKEVQTWAFREASFDSYLATSFVVDTPDGKQVVGKVELNSDELRLPPRLSLKPGETARQTVSLNKWSINFLGPRSFQTLGVYSVRCYHYLDPLGDPYGFPHERTAESAIPVERALLKSPPVRLTMVAENADVNAQGENQAGASDEQAKVDALKARIKRQGVQLGESMPAAAVPGKKPQPKGLALEVEFEPREQLLAEPVLVRCSLTNYGDEPITLSYGHRAEQQNTIFFDIVGPDGKPVPWSNDLRIDSPGPQPLVISAGRRYVEMYNLVDCYDLTRPGTYKINVRYESDGRSFNASSLQWREDLWKGKLERPAGALKIVAPTRPEDKAALDALLSKAMYGADSPFRFLYLFHGESSESFDGFLREHSASRYAPYARFGNALAALRRVQNGTPSYAAAAIANLEAIDPAGCPALFAEQRLFHLLEARLAAESPADQVNPLVERLLSKYPHSPLLSSS